MTGASTLGSMSTNMIRESLAPSDLAASTNSRSRSESTWPRTMRATDAQLKNPITKMVIDRLGPVIDTRAIATSRNGMHRTTSTRRGQHRVHEAAEETGGEPDDDPGHHGDARGDDTDEQRDPRAVGDPDKDVAAQIVGAHPELARGAHGQAIGGQPDLAVLLVRWVAGDHGGKRSEDRHQNDEDDDDERDHGDAIAAQSLPREQPWAASLDLLSLGSIRPNSGVVDSLGCLGQTRRVQAT